MSTVIDTHARVMVVAATRLQGALLTDVLGRHGFDATPSTLPEVTESAVAGRADAAVVELVAGNLAESVNAVAALHTSSPRVGVVLVTAIPRLDLLVPDARSRLGRAALLTASQVTDASLVVEAVGSVLPSYDGPPIWREGTLPPPLDVLSGLQLDLLRRIASGGSNEQIATDRGVSLRAVESLASRTFAAMGLADTPGNPRVRAVTTYLRAMGGA
ncbi:MAG: hypothetical protein NTZ03_12475 [Actinobacteria bacterium]|nr:hypothetical protein [Actinomycetota bacterium]